MRSFCIENPIRNGIFPTYTQGSRYGNDSIIDTCKLFQHVLEIPSLYNYCRPMFRLFLVPFSSVKNPFLLQAYLSVCSQSRRWVCFSQHWENIFHMVPIQRPLAQMFEWPTKTSRNFILFYNTPHRFVWGMVSLSHETDSCHDTSFQVVITGGNGGSRQWWQKGIMTTF